MKIALFSDVHGRLRIVLHLIRCWQMAHEEYLDGALIAGDLGCYPDPSRYDRATRRWIERDPEEAGFSRYFANPKADVAAMLTGGEGMGPFSAVKCPILFTPGNHEDYEYLNEKSKHGGEPGSPCNTFPVDCYKAFHCIQNGTVTELNGRDGARLRVGALWGIEDTRPGAPYRISIESVGRLLDAGPRGFDVLLTHDTAAGLHPSWRGSTGIREIIELCEPPFHVFGHVHPVDGKQAYALPGIRTQSWILEDVGFGKKCNGTLAGTMAILTWKAESGTVELVTDSCLDRMRHRNWESIFPL